MKNIILIFVLLLFSFGYTREDTPIFTGSSSLNNIYLDNNIDKINYDGMKKSQKIREIQDDSDKKEPTRIRIDVREINHQRALDYTTKFNDTMMVPFF